MPRLLRLLLVAGFFVVGLTPAAGVAQDEDGVVVADVRGPLEQQALDFLTTAVTEWPGQLVVIQIDNPGIASGDPTALYAAIESSERPVVAWVGPSGAQAFGGAGRILELVGYRGAAPATEIGYLQPTVAGVPELEVHAGLSSDELSSPLDTEKAVVSDPIEGFVDEVVPTIGQFIASLHGRTLPTAAGPVEVTTTTTTTGEDGSELIVPAVEVTFLKPSLWDRFLRLAMRPEATFFFLVVGIAAVAFEFYAAGVGISAAVAALSLFLAGFGIASLPMNWLSLVLVVVGMWLYTVDFQNAGISWRGVLGTVLLVWGGLNLTAASPQFAPEWWAVVLSVVGVAGFYMVAMTTVARSRFSTRTIGREQLVGRRGVAETDFTPTGIVDLDGARWKARSHRAAGLGAGDAVEVLSVSGIMLEVGPPESTVEDTDGPSGDTS